MDLRFIWLFFFMTSQVTCLRLRRAGGRVSLPASITPPRKLHKGQTPEPKPGWTHCIRDVRVTGHWRVISSENVASQATQFQCTWRLKSETGQQIQISIQKLNLGNSDDTRCQQQFLEIIDEGKSQGRYCDRSVPGDYVTLGTDVRIDIQGEGDLVKLVRDKRSPFLISYKSVSATEPGFRLKVTKPDNYDPYHLITQNQVRQHKILHNKNPGYTPTKAKKKNNGLCPSCNSISYYKTTPIIPVLPTDKDKEKRFGSLSLAGLISIVVCAILVFIVAILLLLNRCCCCWRKKKNIKKDVENGKLKAAYANKAFLLPSAIKDSVSNGPVGEEPDTNKTTSKNSGKESKQSDQYFNLPTKVKITTSSQENETKKSSSKRKTPKSKIYAKEKVLSLNLRTSESKKRSSKSRDRNLKEKDEKNNNTNSSLRPRRHKSKKRSSDKDKSLKKVSTKSRHHHRGDVTEKEERKQRKSRNSSESTSREKVQNTARDKVRPSSSRHSKKPPSNHRKRAKNSSDGTPRRRP